MATQGAVTMTMTEPTLNHTVAPPLLPRENGIAFSIAFLAEMVLAVVGNSIVFGAFTKPRQRQQRSRHLLINLAVADFLVGCVCIPLRVYILADYFELWPYERGIASDLYETLGAFLEGASISSLVMISFERKHAIVRPVAHRTLPKEAFYAVVGLVWLLAAIVPAAYLLNSYGFIPQRAALLTWLAFLAAAPILISINYLCTWISYRFGTAPNSTARNHETKLAMSVFVMTTVSMATILPAPVTYLYFYFSRKSKFGGCLETCRFLYLSMQVLYYANSFVNPIIYTLRMPQVREYALQLICSRPPRHSQPIVLMRIRRANQPQMRQNTRDVARTYLASST